MAPEIEIAGRRIGCDHSPFVIAEVSANHNGSLDAALEIMAAAKEAGAHAVKVQTYTADTITIDHDGPGFKLDSGLWKGYTLYELYREAYTPWEWHSAIFEKGRELGLVVFSSPFDATAVDLLTELNAPAFKIASFELLDLPLIRLCASTGKPLIMSTGMADLAEISAAVSAAREAGAEQLALLHCTSGYPTPPEDANLRTLPHLAQAFGLVTGLSDHTPGSAAPVAAVALGASIIEKHIIMRRSDGGPDSAFSLEPNEFRAVCDGVELAWRALGKVSYDKAESEKGNVHLRRSLYIVKDMEADEVLTKDNLRSIRPGFGLAPKYVDILLGMRVSKPVKRGTPMSWELVG